MRPETVRRQRRAIARVWSHIASQPKAAMSLGHLADVAAMSPCHFARVYEGFVGEPIMKAVRRERLRQVESELTETDGKITAIATQAGYSCGQAFARALKKTTGTSPTDTRRAAFLYGPPAPPTLQIVVLAERPAFGIDFRGTYEDEVAAFDELMGYAYADTELTHISKLRRKIDGITMLHDGGHTGEASVRTSLVVGDQMPRRYAGHMLPGGRYVVIEHCGSLAQTDALVADAKVRMERELKVRPADRPMLREWVQDAQLLPPDQLQIRIYLPVEP
jgi:AraC family transcriptional regulator